MSMFTAQNRSQLLIAGVLVMSASALPTHGAERDATPRFFRNMAALGDGAVRGMRIVEGME